MIVIDRHLGIAFNALCLNRDLTRSVHQLRQDEAGIEPKHSGTGGGTVTFTDLRGGGVADSLVTLLARAKTW